MPSHARDRDPLLGLMGALRMTQGRRVLDVGCGDGGPLRAMARSGAWLVGVDRHANRFPPERERWRHNVAYCAGEASRLPFRDGSFDVVTSTHAIHHFRDREEALAEMARVVAKGGLLGVVDGIVPSAGRVADFLHRAHDIRDGEGEVRFVAVRDLRKLLKSAGFHPLRLEAHLVPHDVRVWAGRGNGARPTPKALEEHFAAASPVVRSILRMEPREGPPHGFSTIEATFLARRV